MKRNIRLFFLAFLLPLNVLYAQDFLGFSTSNYSGVTGIDLQPASLVDSRYKIDVTVAGGSLFGYNNFIGLHTDALKDTGVANDPHFRENYLVIRDIDKNKSLFLRNQIQLPSALLTLNRKEAVAFTWRVRNYLTVDGIESDLATLFYEELREPDLYDRELSNKKLSIQMMSWAEYGFCYGRVLKDEGKHFVKAGGRLKLLQGIGAAYLYANDLNYKFSSYDTLSFINSQVSYGHSTNFEANGNNIGYKFTSKPGVGIDIGAVYEFRPRRQNYIYEMDGDTGLYMRHKNKYKLKVGISILDIGGIKFNRSPQSGDFTADINMWNVSKMQDIKSAEEFDDTLRSLFPFNEVKSTFWMNLPTSVSTQVDYKIYSDFYVNFTTFFAFQFKNNENKIHELTTLSLVPRWDHKWVGAFIPFSYNTLTGMNVGLSLRAGPLIIGTTDLLPFIGTRAIYGADLYMALKVPILYRSEKDKDKDKVSDKKDKCIDLPGVWEFMGCPDCDGDHIPDDKDECPDHSGLIEFNGCPDIDNDKVIDKLDSCPEVPGLIELAGCPDMDGDKIFDMRDSCPDVPGVPEFYGCPDRDGDHIQDKEDQCPDDAGPIEQNGCPDKDGDGLFDNQDLCPDVPGTIENKGCPFPDKDGDGVFDKEDKCPETPGLKENFGCPVLAKEEEEVINTAFSNLEFETGKDIIKTESYSSLEKLAKLLVKKPSWTLKLSGHTDNQGSPKKNMILSEKRSKSVKKFLVEKGVDEKRILTEWFGQKKPIAPNTTPEGRQKNRRVEMNIIFN